MKKEIDFLKLVTETFKISKDSGSRAAEVYFVVEAHKMGFSKKEIESLGRAFDFAYNEGKREGREE